MIESRALPDAELFYGLYDGVFKPHLVRIAIQWDLFTPLAGQPLDAASLARAVGADPKGIERLADYLVAVVLLENLDGRYSPTASARVFLARDSQAYAGDQILGFTGPEFWERVTNSLQSGQPTTLLERFEQDAWVESYRTSRVASSLEMWQAAGIRPGVQAEVRILDLACGCGIKSFCLAQMDPSVHVTCVDRAEVLAVAQDLAKRMGLAGRVRLVPADLRSVPLEEARYEACLAGQITHYLTEEQNRALFKRVLGALVSGGKFLIDVPLGREEPDAATAFLSLLLWANSCGTAYAYEAYQDWLLASGFDRVRRAGERWIVAEK